MGLRVDISSASLLLGMVIGGGLMLAGSHYLPRTMLPAPTVAIDILYHGVDEAGVPALCDSQGWAYDISDEHGVVHRSIDQPADPEGHIMMTLKARCKGRD